MLSKLKQRKRLIIAVFCLSVISIWGGVILWPRQCGSFLYSEGDLTFYFVTPIFSDESSLPELITEQWTLDASSKEYQEIISIMDKYLCHISLGGLTKNNHATWVIVYNSNGIPIVEYQGTNRVRILGTTYSIYGTKDNGTNMINSIHSILSTPQ